MFTTYINYLYGEPVFYCRSSFHCSTHNMKILKRVQKVTDSNLWHECSIWATFTENVSQFMKKIHLKNIKRQINKVSINWSLALPAGHVYDEFFFHNNYVTVKYGMLVLWILVSQAIRKPEMKCITSQASDK